MTDNSEQVLAALKNATQRACEVIGEKGESYAKALAKVKSGILRNSITHKVSDEGGKKVVTVGSNVHYAP